jgi:hypothetical protein
MHSTTHSTAGASPKRSPFGTFPRAAVPILRTLPHIAAHIYLVLASHENGNSKTSWPGLKLLAQEAGCSRRSLLRALDQLEATGLITRTRRRRQSNVYRVLEVPSGAPQTILEVPPVTPVGCHPWHPELDKKNKTNTDLLTSFVGQEQDKGLNHVAEERYMVQPPPARSANDDRRNGAKKESALVASIGDVKPPSEAEIAAFWSDVLPTRMRIFGQSEKEILHAYPRFLGTRPPQEVQPCS